MQGKKYFLAATLLVLSSFHYVFGQICDCVTTGNCPVPIQDNGTFQGTLDVTVNGVNDLGVCPLTSLCFTIDHTWVGDLSASLTSPSGLNYLVMADANNSPGGCGTNADDLNVCIVPGTGNPLTNNTQYVCNGANPCLSGNWTMPCGGVTDPVSGAVQAPGCNLNAFNVPGSPANGTWTLTINDICGSDVGQLLNFSLNFACGADCVSCEANGGVLNEPDVVGCQGSGSLNISPSPSYPGGGQPDAGSYSYAWVVSQNGTILSVNSSPSVAALPPGSYSLCGFSYINSAGGQLNSLVGMNLGTAQGMFTSATAPFCGDFSDDCFNVTIGPPIPPTQLDTFACLGQCIELGTLFVCSSGPVTLESWLGCDSVVNVNIDFILPITTTENYTVCQGECIEIANQFFCPPGSVLILPNWQGCDSVINIEIEEILTEAVINPNPPPVLSCSNPVASLDAFGSTPGGALLTWQGPNGFTSNQQFINVNTPGTYTLTVTNNTVSPPCISEASVFIDGDQQGPSLQLNGPNPFYCVGNSFDLSELSIVDLNGTDPTITFHSGTPATLSNQLFNTVVSPSVTTTYYVLGTTGTCFDQIPVTLTVYQPPVATFSATSPVCAGETSIVTFTGQASPTAEFNWDFDGGTPSPGFGPGPHTVIWNSGGTYSISLFITDNGCESGSATQTVEVGDILPDPIINCFSTSSEITFSWDPVPGATGYNVTVVDGPTGTMLGPESYFVSNLLPNQSVTISVEAISDSACPNSVSVYTCAAENCPPVSVIIDPVADICLNASTSPVQLVASQMGGAGGGTFTWSGQGVNPSTGLFTPSGINIGSNTFVASYEEGTCTYNGSVTVNVYQTPSSSFTATSPICSPSTATVDYTGNASNSATYTWNFGGGTATPGTGPGPHSVTWPIEGTYTISLSVAENGCQSTTTSQTVEMGVPIAAPQISCNTTTNSIEFAWNNVPGASGYDVNVISGGTGVATSDTSMVFTGLNPGASVTLQVIALDPGPCPDVPAQTTCIAQDCPPVTIVIEPVDDICLDANAATVTLQANVSGGAGTGSLSWSGPGVSVGGVFDPQLANLGANLITVVYEDGICIYTEDISINVLAQPVASFTAPSPTCVDEGITVTYTGTSAPGMQFDWDFGTATATPGTGVGPHTVSWADSGTQPISLTVTSAQGCVSAPFSANVQVDEPLVAPTISCNTMIDAIEFTWTNVPGASGYSASVTSGPSGTQTSQNSYEVTGLAPNSQVTLELTVTSGGACPDVTVQQTCIAQDCPTVTITIPPVPGICLDGAAGPVILQANIIGGAGTGTTTWSGTGVGAGGIFDPALASVGAHTLTATYTEGNCIYTQTTTVNVFAQPVASFTAATTVCEGDATTVTYTGTAAPGIQFDWDFGTATATPGTGIGPHTLSWADSGAQPISLTVTSAQGCVSEPFNATVLVDEPLLAPLINCNTTLSSIEFFWPDVVGAVDYSVVVLSGTPGSQTSQNTYEVTGLLPNSQVAIELTVSGNGICPPVTVQETCIAQNCLPIIVSVDAVPPLCIDAATVQLSATVTGAAGGGVGTWSGPGTSPSGVFDPAAAGVGTHQVVYAYVENNCTYQAAGAVQVLPKPTANFSASANICIEDAATVTYTGTAPSSATYAWDFGGGTATPGTGQGPHQVEFQAAGSYDISLVVTQNGCESEPVTHTVEVDPTLVVPDVDCNTTVSSIEFTWGAVANGTDYEVTVLTGQTGNQTSQNAYLLDGLQPNEQVTIELTVSGNTLCPPVTVQETCIATDCPAVTIEIEPVGPICFGANAGNVQLQATVTGGSGTAGTWSGPGVSADGIFDVVDAGVGTHTVTFVYEENASCSYDESLQITVVAPPVADAGPDGEITCEENQTSFELGGDGSTSGVGITYGWAASSGSFPGDSTILHPVVSVPGTYTLTVTNTALPNCSDTDVAEVEASQDIPQPQVNIVPVSCFGENDGAISVSGVTGGQAPYLYSLNGGDYAATSTFQPLAPGIYVVSVIDASGCEASLTVDITQPQELNVNLVAVVEGGGNIIRLGDTTELQALVSLPADSLDNVQWYPRELVSCDTCLTTFTSPTSQTTFSITVESNGCVASDDLTLFVKKDRPVYVPNAFSPNGDGPNEVFMIFAGKEVAKVRSFLVFDRWGETVFQYYTFPPNNPAYGWDGKHRGDLLNPGVFTWYAEIEFVDGKVELYEGDVTLMR